MSKHLFSFISTFVVGAAGVLAGSSVRGASWQAGASADADEAQRVEPLTLMRSSEVPLGAARVVAEGEKADTTFVDTYVDWDTGAVTLLSDKGGLATMPLPANWKFCHAVVHGGLVSIAYQPGSGLSYYLSEDGVQWVPIEEPSDQLTVGSYGVYLAGAEESMYAMRYDEFTGRSWILDGEAWRSIEGNLPPVKPVEPEGK